MFFFSFTIMIDGLFANYVYFALQLYSHSTLTNTISNLLTRCSWRVTFFFDCHCCSALQIFMISNLMRLLFYIKLHNTPLADNAKNKSIEKIMLKYNKGRVIPFVLGEKCVKWNSNNNNNRKKIRNNQLCLSIKWHPPTKLKCPNTCLWHDKNDNAQHRTITQSILF